MAGGETTLLADLGKTRVTAPTPAGERVEGGMRYVANTSEGPMTVTVLDRRCNDTMTGMPHPHAVTVQFAGRTLTGCGGDPAALLQGREWVVEDLNRTGIIDRSRATLSFGADGYLAGMGSCNTYLARYSLSGEGLAITRPASTGKACPPASMRQEDLFLDILAKVQRFDIDPTGALVLRASDGRSITARRP
jgi:heat shock protein HslJ